MTETNDDKPSGIKKASTDKMLGDVFDTSDKKPKPAPAYKPYVPDRREYGGDRSYRYDPVSGRYVRNYYQSQYPSQRTLYDNNAPLNDPPPIPDFLRRDLPSRDDEDTELPFNDRLDDVLPTEEDEQDNAMGVNDLFPEDGAVDDPFNTAPRHSYHRRWAHAEEFHEVTEEKMQMLANKCHIAIANILDQERIVWTGDNASQLNRILRNLVDNSAYYDVHRGIHLRIKVATPQSGKPGRRV